MQKKEQIKYHPTGLLLKNFNKMYPLHRLREVTKGIGIQYSYNQSINKTFQNLNDNDHINAILININKKIASKYSYFEDSIEEVFLNIIIFIEIEYLNDYVNNELNNRFDLDFGNIFRDSEFLEKMNFIANKLIQNLEATLFSTPMPNSFLDAWVHQYLYQLIDEILEINHPRAKSAFKQDDIEKIQNLEAIIRKTRVNSMPSISEMAESVGMSPTKFKKIFKEVFGTSTRQYILDIKTEQAQLLLRSNSHSISQVARKLGFNNPSGLARLLKNKL